MPEIFRFTQLRAPTGINIDEVRQQHIQFFNKIEAVQDMEVNKAFLKSFENGILYIEKYIKENEGFHIRSEIPKALIRGDYEKFNKTFFELSYLLSHYNSDKKENRNKELFAQIKKKIKEIDQKKLKEYLSLLNVHFEDLLVLYFRSNAYPSYLRVLIGLRRWHYVLSSFSLSEILKSFESIPEQKEKAKLNPVLHFLLNAKILLPKYLFTKAPKEPSKPTGTTKPKVSDKPKVKTKLKTKTKAIKTTPLKK